MPVNYLNLQQQIHQLGEAAVKQHDTLEDRLVRCQRLLAERADALSELQQFVEQAVLQDKNLRCAVPVSEALNAHIAAPDVPLADCTILSADGSQITPNPHEAVYYGLVNIGLFQMQPGSAQAPLTQVNTELIYETDDDSATPVTEDLINLRRDVAERKQLVTASRGLPRPLITLTDGQLELYNEPREHPAFRKYFDQYIAALQNLAGENVITAGYVDRPRAALLIKLLDLAAQSPDSLDVKEHSFSGLNDLSIMRGLLQAGERSAVFAMQSSSTKEYTDRIALHFFYLNVGGPARPILARVEIPKWVAHSADTLNLLHAALLDQARLSGLHPYPYALLRAHETAVVKFDESAAIKDMIQRELLGRGIDPEFDSEKLANKKVGTRTRFNL
jgi:NurA domain.